jgi:hypothetical protein
MGKVLSKRNPLENALKHTHTNHLNRAPVYVIFTNVFVFVCFFIQSNENALPYTTKVMGDENGMLPYIMTFMDHDEKLLTLSLVSKSFNKVVHLPDSWHTISITSRSGKVCTYRPWMENVRVLTAGYHWAPWTIERMPPFAMELKRVQRVLLRLDGKAALKAITVWPQLQSLCVHNNSSLPTETSDALACQGSGEPSGPSRVSPVISANRFATRSWTTGTHCANSSWY